MSTKPKNTPRAVHDRGQNFLIDHAAVHALADAAGFQAGDAVVEIGPGPGILTEELLSRGARVLAVELDARFLDDLKAKFAGQSLIIENKDINEMGNAALAAALGVGAGGYRVAANIPYNLTSRIIERFLTEEPRPASLTLMVQREVADRLLAGAGEMSSLAVLVRTYGDPSRVRNVPRGAFRPTPKVDSAVIHIRVRTGPELSSFFGEVDKHRYFELVRAGFAAPRKKLRNTLAGFFGTPANAEEAIKKAEISENSRPEELLPEDWLRLARQRQ